MATPNTPDRSGLSAYAAKNPIHFRSFISYCQKMDSDKDRESGQYKNPYFHKISNDKLIEFYKRVEEEGLVLDGKHISIQSTGISYDFVAYKNKMLLVYPGSIIDCQLVRKGDKFKVSKHSGEIEYTHEFADPFSTEQREVVGGYCVIKNKRGNFITLLTEEDFLKHKKIAKTPMIWNSWGDEMRYKTLMKKSVKVHFDDIYCKMEQDEEGQYDLGALKNESISKLRAKSTKQVFEELPEHKEWQQRIDNIENEDEMKLYLDTVAESLLDDQVHSSMVLKRKSQISKK